MMIPSEREYTLLLERVQTGAARSYVNALRKIDAILAPKQALPAINAPELKMGAENRADGQDGAADAILHTHPLPQVEIDPSPLTDDEIAYGQRIANDPAWDAPGI